MKVEQGLSNGFLLVLDEGADGIETGVRRYYTLRTANISNRSMCFISLPGAACADSDACRCTSRMTTNRTR